MAILPAPNNPKVVKAALVYSRDERELVNTFHFARVGGWDLPRMTLLANDLKTWWNTIYRTAVPAAVQLNQVQIRLLDPSNPLAVDLPVIPPIVGTRTGQPEAGNVTVTMSERTGLAGRARRGRVYVPALSEVDVSSNDLVASVLTQILSNAIANLIFGFTTSEGILAVFHRPHVLPHPLDNLYDLITTWVVEDIVDSQRRRLPGRGR